MKGSAGPKVLDLRFIPKFMVAINQFLPGRKRGPATDNFLKNHGHAFIQPEGDDQTVQGMVGQFVDNGLRRVHFAIKVQGNVWIAGKNVNPAAFGMGATRIKTGDVLVIIIFLGKKEQHLRAVQTVPDHPVQRTADGGHGIFSGIKKAMGGFRFDIGKQDKMPRSDQAIAAAQFAFEPGQPLFDHIIPDITPVLGIGGGLNRRTDHFPIGPGKSLVEIKSALQPVKVNQTRPGPRISLNRQNREFRPAFTTMSKLVIVVATATPARLHGEILFIHEILEK
ncbi:MAG TPA: hypothetical protein VK815_12320 [Candidatus Acidoferrales bacterium]|nr:hypothetical protein [Candidatus Acidoferrales bacterium]